MSSLQSCLDSVKNLIEDNAYEEIVANATASNLFRDRLRVAILTEFPSFQRYIPLLQTDFKSMQALFPMWMVSEAHTQRLLSETDYDEYMFFKERSRPKTQDPIVTTRANPYGLDEAANAISFDDIGKFRICFANPNFVNKTDYMTYIADWNAMECFRFMLLNGGNIKVCLTRAVECGRQEMIEVLEQSGANLASCLQFAIDGYQTEIIDWLLNTDRVPKSSVRGAINLACDKNCHEAIKILLGYFDGKPDCDTLMAAVGVDNEVAEEMLAIITPAIVRKQIDILKPGFFQRIGRAGSPLLVKEMSRINPEETMEGALQRIPFDENIAKSIKPRLPRTYTVTSDVWSLDALRWMKKCQIPLTRLSLQTTKLDVRVALEEGILSPYDENPKTFVPLFWELFNLSNLKCWIDLGADVHRPNSESTLYKDYVKSKKGSAEILSFLGCENEPTTNDYGRKIIRSIFARK